MLVEKKVKITTFRGVIICKFTRKYPLKDGNVPDYYSKQSIRFMETVMSKYCFENF
ncbi:hypothetical protein SAMN05444380_101178 [Thermophagus xiamenensis]|jgi:hypothetical protein|uniref:Uncharacterized protein n=1 Tax=Thermophagus xiamenensis TaxID=385682 RepID=A0A1I1UXA2_9BACT|nr:hypothetical protein SAMN05444380_101178 [Thermophagus xiamenensis]